MEHVEFHFEGAMLRGLLLRPDSEAHPPIVIMTHGTSATIRMVADEYAEVFRRSGLAVLLYDHRNLGASGESHGRRSTRGSSAAAAPLQQRHHAAQHTADRTRTRDRRC